MRERIASDDVKKPRTLADAIVDTVREPLVVLDRDLRVVAASRSFYLTFGVVPDDTQGRLFYELADGQWSIPALRKLLEEVIPKHRVVEAYEIEHDFASVGRRTLLLNARQVFDEANPDSALLLAIEDVTHRRAGEREKDELLREKELLLEEMRHRVANSLQIIASVLMQGAKKVRSQQARGHLRDARNRVMSIATMQRQLAASRLGDVVLRDYFSDLCASIGASMISDHDQLTLEVKVDESMTKADVSVSLGLIVTELVINALKHAFPRHRKGKICVDYRSDGPAWTLSVRDTGIGMPADRAAKPGLGTGIVEALAKQLGATVEVATSKGGTTVSIVHE